MVPGDDDRHQVRGSGERGRAGIAVSPGHGQAVQEQAADGPDIRHVLDGERGRMRRGAEAVGKRHPPHLGAGGLRVPVVELNEELTVQVNVPPAFDHVAVIRVVGDPAGEDVFPTRRRGEALLDGAGAQARQVQVLAPGTGSRLPER